jgi:hypothetical protein
MCPQPSTTKERAREREMRLGFGTLSSFLFSSFFSLLLTFVYIKKTSYVRHHHADNARRPFPMSRGVFACPQCPHYGCFECDLPEDIRNTHKWVSFVLWVYSTSSSRDGRRNKIGLAAIRAPIREPYYTRHVVIKQWTMSSRS